MADFHVFWSIHRRIDYRIPSEQTQSSSKKHRNISLSYDPHLLDGCVLELGILASRLLLDEVV